MKTLCTILLLTSAACAQTTRTFKAEAAALAAGTTVDYISTVMSTHQGLIEASYPKGTAEIYGKHPTALSTLPMFAISAGEAFIAYKLERNRHRVVRLAGHGIMLEESFMHFDDASNNFVLQRSRR